MIPYAELERALQRWKARQAGEPVAEMAEAGALVESDRVSVDASYVESEADDAFPTHNAGTNEIIVVGDVDEN